MPPFQDTNGGGGLDNQLAAHQEKAYAEALAEQQARDLQQQRSAPAEALKHAAVDRAKDQAKKAAVQLGKAAVKRVAQTQLGAALLVAWPYLLAFLGIILVLIATIVVIFGLVAYQCNQQGTKGALVRAISTAASYVGMMDFDVCAQMNFPAGTQLPVDPVNENLEGAAQGDAIARAYLLQFGITVNFPQPRTSLEGMLQSTLDEVVRFKLTCDQWLLTTTAVAATQQQRLEGCTVVVTGGTEKGHVTEGTCIHGGGYKVDLRLNDYVNTFIQTNYRPIAPRRNGDPQWVNTYSNSYYAMESDHWDIGVGCA